MFGYLCLLDVFQIPLPISETTCLLFAKTQMKIDEGKGKQNHFQEFGTDLFVSRTCHALPPNPFRVPKSHPVIPRRRAHESRFLCPFCVGGEWLSLGCKKFCKEEWVWYQPQYNENKDWILYELLNCVFDEVPSFGFWPLYLRVPDRKIRSIQEYNDWKEEFKESERSTLAKNVCWVTAEKLFSSGSCLVGLRTMPLLGAEWVEHTVTVPSVTKKIPSSSSSSSPSSSLPLTSPMPISSFYSPFMDTAFAKQLAAITHELHISMGGNDTQVKLYQKRKRT